MKMYQKFKQMKTTSTFGIHFKMRTERMKDGKAPIFLGLVVKTA